MCFRGSHLCPQNRERLWGRQWTLFIVSLLPAVTRGCSPHSSPPPRGLESWEKATADLRRLQEEGCGWLAATRLCCPQTPQTLEEGRQARCEATRGHSLGASPGRPATGVLEPGAVRPPTSAGLPGSHSGVCCEGPGETPGFGGGLSLAVPETSGPLSPANPPSVAALTER